MGFLKDSFKESGIAFDKVRAPDETLEWIRGQFDHLSVPILQDTRRIDRGRLGIPVYLSRYTLPASRLTGKFSQMGKGVTSAQAETSAVMELVERFSLFDFLQDGGHRVASASGLDGDVLPLGDMLKAIHAKNQGEDSLKAWELIKSLPFDWVRAYRPLDGREFWLPLSWFWPLNRYNGSASGNSLEEAAVQALSEVVERHVCSIITYERLTTPTIDLDSIRDPMVRGLLDKFERLSIHLVLKDFSLDLGIPTVGAIAWDPSTFPDRSEIVYTAGTAPDPIRAVIRTLTEVAQLAGDFDREGRYVESGLPKFSSLDEASYVLDAPSKVSIDAMPSCSSDNFRLEVEGICETLVGAGLNAYLVDITHPELGIPAVYAVIPGNHFRDRTRGLDVPFHCARLVDSIEDPHQALSFLTAIEDLYPRRFHVAFYTGHVYERLGDYREALNWYSRALELKPAAGELASIYCQRGACYKEMEDFPRAIDELEQARDLNPGLKEIYNLLGYCFYRIGEHLKAIDAFEQAISIDPGSAIDYANIASNLGKLGMREAAIKWYGMALELDPGLSWARDKMQELQPISPG